MTNEQTAERDEYKRMSKRSSIGGAIEDWDDLEGQDVDRYVAH